MTYYPTCHLEYWEARKIKKLKIYALDIYCSDFVSTLIDNSKDKKSSSDILIVYRKKPGNCIFITKLIPKHFILYLHTITVHLQRFSIVYRQAHTIERANQTLSPYI